MLTIEEMKIKLLNENLEELLKSLNDYDVKEFDKFGNNLMHYYVKNADVIKISAEKLIPELLKKGLDINSKQSKSYFRTALYLAVLKKSKKIVELLIKMKADIDLSDENGNSPLWQAVMDYKGQDDFFVKILLENNAESKLQNKHGVSPASLANTIANTDVRKFFAAKKAND